MLRGFKGEIYEGGTKVPSFIHFGRDSALEQGNYDNLFHAVDILPTIMDAVGSNIEESNIDGVNHWDALTGFQQRFVISIERSLSRVKSNST